MKKRVLKVSLALSIALLMVFGVSSAAFAFEAADATTPLGRFLESLKRQSGKESDVGEDTPASKKQYFLTIVNKIDQYAEGDNSDTKYEFTLTFNKGKDSKISEKLTLKNKGAKVYKLEEGTAFDIASKPDGRYSVSFDGGQQGTMTQNKTVTAISAAASTYSLTVSNECEKGGPGNSVNIRITFDSGARYETITVNAGESKAIKNIPQATSYSCETTAAGLEFVSGSGTISANTTVTIKDSEKASPPIVSGSEDNTSSSGSSGNGDSNNASGGGSGGVPAQQDSDVDTASSSHYANPGEIKTNAPLTIPGVTGPSISGVNISAAVDGVSVGDDDDDDGKGDTDGIGSSKPSGEKTQDGDDDDGPKTGDAAVYAFWALIACASLVGIVRFRVKAI